jgi:hypothetical protein
MKLDQKKLIITYVFGIIITFVICFLAVVAARHYLEKRKAATAPIQAWTEQAQFKNNGMRIFGARIHLSTNQMTLLGGAILRAQNADRAKRLAATAMIAAYGLPGYTGRKEVRLDAEGDIALTLPWEAVIPSKTEVAFEIVLAIQCAPELEASGEKLKFDLFVMLRNRNDESLSTEPTKIQKIITVTCGSRPVI